MPITVRGPDGVENNFPDGTDDATIERAMGQVYGAPEAAKPKRDFRSEFGKAVTAKDAKAAETLYNEWTEDNIAQGKRTLQDLDNEALRNSLGASINAKDEPGLAMAVLEAKRRGIDVQQLIYGPGVLEQAGQFAGQIAAGAANLPAAAAETAGAFGRGVQRILPDNDPSNDVTGDEYLRVAETGVRSLTAPIGGDYVAAAGSALAGKGFNPDEQRAQRQALGEENPLTAASMEVLGGGALGKLTQPLGGGMVRQGAIQASIAAPMVTGDLSTAVPAALVGAGAGKALDYAAKAAKAATNPLAALAKRIKGPDGKPVPVAQLDADFKRLEAALGRKPTMVELADEATTRKLASLAEGRSGAATAFREAQVADDAARPARFAATTQRGGPVATVEDVVSREEALSAQRTRGIDAAAQEEIAAAGAGARSQLQATRAQTEEAVAAQAALADRARQNITRELTRATEAGDLAGVQRATTLRDEWANATMRDMERAPILFGRETVQNQLQNRHVLRAMTSMADAAPNPQARALLETKINHINEGQAVYLTARELDSIRRTLNAAAEVDPALRTGLGQVSEILEDRARRALPAYGQFLDDYAARSQEIEGITQGLRVMSPGGASGFAQVAEDATGPMRGGIEQGARTAISDAARRAPESTARAISGDPTKALAALGPRGREVVDAAINGARTIDGAIEAARQAGITGRGAEKAIRDRYTQLKGEIGARRSRDVSFERDRAATRTSAATRAGRVLTDDAAEFEAAITASPEDLRGDLSAIARGRIASTAGESPRDAVRVAETLASPGGRRRTAAVLGQSEADRLGTAAEAEFRGARNLASITKEGADQFVDPSDVKKLGSLVATAAMKTKSPGVLSAGLEAAVKTLRGIGMAPGVARKVAELATSPDGVEKVVAFMQRARVNDTTTQKVLRALALQPTVATDSP